MRNCAGPDVPQQVGVPAFNKGYSQLRGEKLELLQNHQRNCHRSPGNSLPQQFGARSEAQAAFLNHFDVVVGEADCAKGHRGDDRNPYERVGQIRPKQCGQQNCNSNQHSAHGGRAGLRQMRLRPVVANVLADLKLAQLLNHPWADEERNEQRRQRGKSGAEGQVTEDAERVKVNVQLFVKQPVKQVASRAGTRQVSS